MPLLVILADSAWAHVYRGGRIEWRPVTAKQSLASGDLLPTPPTPRQICETKFTSPPFSCCPRECERVRALWANAPPNRVASGLTRGEGQVTAEHSLRCRPSGGRDGQGSRDDRARGAISLGVFSALVQLPSQFRFPWAACVYGGWHRDRLEYCERC